MVNYKVVVRNNGEVVHIDGLFVCKRSQITDNPHPRSLPTVRKATVSSYLTDERTATFGSSGNADGSLSWVSPLSAAYSLLEERNPEDEDASNHFLASIDPVPSSMVRIKLDGCLRILLTQPQVSIFVKNG